MCNVYRCTTCNDYTLGSLWVLELEYSIVRGTECICPFIVWNNTHSVWIITQTRINDTSNGTTTLVLKSIGYKFRLMVGVWSVITNTKSVCTFLGVVKHLVHSFAIYVYNQTMDTCEISKETKGVESVLPTHA